MPDFVNNPAVFCCFLVDMRQGVAYNELSELTVIFNNFQKFDYTRSYYTVLI